MFQGRTSSSFFLLFVMSPLFMCFTYKYLVCFIMYMFYNVHRVSLVWTAFLGNSFSDRCDYLYCIQTFDQKLVNLLHGLLNCEIGRLDMCPLLPTHVTPILQCIGPCNLFRSFRSIFINNNCTNSTSNNTQLRMG